MQIGDIVTLNENHIWNGKSGIITKIIGKQYMLCISKQDKEFIYALVNEEDIRS